AGIEGFAVRVCPCRWHYAHGDVDPGADAPFRRSLGPGDVHHRAGPDLPARGARLPRHRQPVLPPALRNGVLLVLGSAVRVWVAPASLRTALRLGARPDLAP